MPLRPVKERQDPGRCRLPDLTMLAPSDRRLILSTSCCHTIESVSARPGDAVFGDVGGVRRALGVTIAMNGTPRCSIGCLVPGSGAIAYLQRRAAILVF